MVGNLELVSARFGLKSLTGVHFITPTGSLRPTARPYRPESPRKDFARKVSDKVSEVIQYIMSTSTDILALLRVH